MISGAQEKVVKSWFQVILTLLLCAGLALAAILAARSYGSELGEEFCVISDAFNCKKLTSSSWAYVLGIPWSLYGFWFYSAWLLVAIFRRSVCRLADQAFLDLMAVASLITLPISIYLFVVSKFVVGVFCPYCLGTYLVNFLIIVICIFQLGSFKSYLKSSIQGLIYLVRLPINIAQKNRLWQSFALLIVAAVSLVATVYVPPVLASLTVNEVDNSQSHQVISKFDGVSFFDGGGPLGDYDLGNKDAKVQIVEFSDLQCPSCRAYSQIIDKIIEKYGGRIHFVFKNFPLDNACNSSIEGVFHPLACLAAEFARCAGEQGAFWRVLHDLYQLPILEDHHTTAELVAAELDKYLTVTGLDVVAIKECLSSDRQLKRIQDDINLGLKINLMQTPTLIINGKIQEDLREDAVFKNIDELLQDE